VTRHVLKCWADQFEALRVGVKTHEVRPDDRHFAVGDVLDLVETKPRGSGGDLVTGRKASYYVTFVTRGTFDGGPVLELHGVIGNHSGRYSGPVACMSVRPLDEMDWPK